MTQAATPAASTLTSRERMNRAIEGRDHDRVPRYETFWRDTVERWQGEGLVGGQAEMLEELGADLHDLGMWSVPFPGHHEVIAEDDETETFVNGWLETVKQWKGRSGTPEHLDWGCRTKEAWEQTFKPALEKATHDDLDADAIREAGAKGNDLQRWRFVAALESFEALRHLLGDVDCMMTLVEDPDWIAEMSRAWTDFSLRRLDKQHEAAGEIDGVWCYGDMAFNHATMCSPAMYRELIWPDHKRLADWAHHHNAKFIYHTDGNINGVLDLYEEAGFDVLQPLEAKADMDIRKLVPERGDRMAFMGNIDVMILATNDRDAIEAEVRAKLEAGMAKKRYIYHSDHSIPPQTSLETYRFVIDLVNKYGNYDAAS